MQFPDTLHIQIGGRLVHDDNLRQRRVDGAAGNLLLLAARQFKNIPIHQLLQIQPVNDLLQTLLHLRAGNILIFQIEGHLACGVQMKELGAGILEYAAHHPGHLGKRCLLHIQTADKNASLQLPGIKMGCKAIHQAKHGRLPAAAFAAQHYTLSLRCLKTYIT